MAGTIREWVRVRAGLPPGTLASWNRPLPRGIGWFDTLGGVALVLLAVQAVTGIILAMYYVPDPQRAYASVEFVRRELPMGRLVHGLHVYGDSALVLVVGLHLVRSYWVGAYKRPRELTWLLGLVLLQLVIGFGFTGYLLPWDQKAYYATQVRTAYAEGVPVIGPAAALLLRGGPEIGALTTTRFYALHALLLPALLLPVLLGYLTLVRRHGYAPPGEPVDAEAVPTGPGFLDRHLFRILAVAAGVVAGVYLLAHLRPAELEFPANPNDSTYHPRPEWYFLWLFQIVADWKNVPVVGGIGWIPVVVLPGLAVTLLALAPWLDRTPERRAARRPLMAAMLLAGLLLVVGFTARAYSQLQPNATPANSLAAEFTAGGERALDPAQVAAGRTAFARCGGCHAAGADFSGRAGPDLTGYGRKSFLRELEGHPDVHRLSYWERFAGYTRGTLRPPQTKMPKYPEDQLSDVELRAIGAYLSQPPPAPTVPPK